ncbi:hypothetical protein EIL87_15465 [Saccharopolyspora rhizosphaerae]|uniref:Uncharacterized protein n=1 Tax=Saccharopolyspora rhizosphaerae TaxID=2492662 RepID=A0A426JQM8_9PSEU|nr:hypothetical protein [Saccharopolyspora rhizosphaerae]RRO15455.1 hypothetical protein EIL87_15465 [Saccharopolyspora rhizosphaerae]
MPANSGLDPTPLDRLRDLLLSRRSALWLRRAAAALLLLLALLLAVSQGTPAVEITTALGRTG